MSNHFKQATNHVTRVFDTPGDLPRQAWNALLAQQATPTPFMRHEYLAALHTSGSATAATGWAPRFVTLWLGDQLVAACPLYIKSHSYGEYVFDWAWASAHERHGVPYYPKGVIAVPFTPVTGSRLLATDSATRAALLRAAQATCDALGLSSMHLLFGDADDLAACQSHGLMQRQTVQFHWRNAGWADFDAFLASLSQDKRKKIRQERRRVTQAGVQFEALHGTDVSLADWDFFYRCYERTYLEHGNAPYLSRSFFEQQAADMPAHWLLFKALRGGQPIAASLIALQPRAGASARDLQGGVAYGRYWGALERVDCLHFEACYYQPLQWCIAHGVARFEGGAQGEHKMARALLPVKTTSAHGLAHPAFADAVAHFLAREEAGIDNYLEDLDERSPFRQMS